MQHERRPVNPIERFASLKGARVLVTGGLGFIGSHLVDELLVRGANVVILDDESTSRDRIHPAGPTVKRYRCDVLELDRHLNEPESDLASDLGSLDLVIHLAAVVGMRLASTERDRAFRVARDGTRAILDATQTSVDPAGDVPVVLFSSSAVYGSGRTGEPMREEDAIEYKTGVVADGGSPGYTAGKLAMELVGKNAAKAGRPVMIVRPFNVVGVGQSDRYGMVLPRLISAARLGNPLRIYDDGAQSRSFGEVEHFVESLLRLVAHPDAWSPSGRIFNLGCALETRIIDLARIVQRVTSSSSRTEFLPFEVDFPGQRDVRARRPDLSRIEALLGDLSWPDLQDVIQAVADAEAISGDCESPAEGEIHRNYLSRRSQSDAFVRLGAR